GGPGAPWARAGGRAAERRRNASPPPLVFPRQSPGLSPVPRAPPLPAHWMLAVAQPADAATSQSVDARMSSEYQYQAVWPMRSGSKIVLARMPCFAGHTPVMSVVWLGYVTVRITPCPPSADAPSAANPRSAGIFQPCF